MKTTREEAFSLLRKGHELDNESKRVIIKALGGIPVEQVKKALDEILCEAKNIDRSEYTTEIQHARADGVLFALGMSAGIISKHCQIDNKKPENI